MSSNKFSKEWCLKMAALEGDQPINAGLLAVDPEICPECNGYGSIDGCGECSTPCTTEGSVVCRRTCQACDGEG